MTIDQIEKEVDKLRDEIDIREEQIEELHDLEDKLNPKEPWIKNNTMDKRLTEVSLRSQNDKGISNEIFP